MLMSKGKQRKPAAERKQRNITIWVDEATGKRFDTFAASASLPVSTWARAQLILATR